jgi:predicted DCC family thiol-disulfide oxidoreductase YuxK
MSISVINMPDKLFDRQTIVFFDGECNLCNSSVLFIIRHNRSKNINFASLQSQAGIQIRALAGNDNADSLLFLQDNIVYDYSTAALKIAAQLEFPWHLLRIFILIPKPARDAIYRFIASNRYRWFGGKPLCLSCEVSYSGRFIL